MDPKAQQYSNPVGGVLQYAEINITNFHVKTPYKVYFNAGFRAVKESITKLRLKIKDVLV